jgi:acyl transferase domain-containing protein
VNAVYFDTKAFGISHKEAQAMDPQMMLVLESSYCALTNAVTSPNCRFFLVNEPLGLFAGAGGSL